MIYASIYVSIFSINIFSSLFIGELYLAPDFLVPPNLDYHGYHEYVYNFLPCESPILYGLHPNAEIGKYM